MYELKKEFIMTDEVKASVRELQNIFFENDHELLHTSKAVPLVHSRAINELYHKYIYPLGNIKWYNPFQAELADLKKDPVCGRNKNKSDWVKSYMLEWVALLPAVADDDFLFSNIAGRESHCFIISQVYVKV